MSHSVSELCDRFSDLIVECQGDLGHFLSVDDARDFGPASLIFVSEAMPELKSAPPAVVVTSAGLAAGFESWGCTVLQVANVRLAQALIKQAYQDYDASDSEWVAVHPSAVIHDTAALGEGVRIGPNSVIGANVVVGDHSQIRANCVVEQGASLGAHCIIHNLVNIGQGCVLGDRVIVRPGTVIGNEGFGFAQGDDNAYQRIPHTGIVVIQDDVQIGANCNIDRATYGQTLIKRGVKIDALCHIAHNCTAGEDALIIAQSGMAGSSRIGDRVICSGQTGILDHMSVVDDAVLVHRCGVTSNIESAEMWAGTPPKPFKDYIRDLNTRKFLEKKIAKLEAKIEKLSTD